MQHMMKSSSKNQGSETPEAGKIERQHCTLLTTNRPANPYASACQHQGETVDISVCMVAQGRGFANCKGCRYG